MRRTALHEITWDLVAPLFDLGGDQALPCRVPCPYTGCAGFLTVSQDNTAGGQWHHCPACGQSGDMIDLAARLWEAGPRVALARLGRAGAALTPALVDAYVDVERERRSRLALLWERSRRHLSAGDEPATCRLRSDYRLRSPIPQRRWDEGPGRLVGAYPTAGIENLLAPRSRARVFPGRGWGESLVVPFEAAPGCTAGFLFVARRNAVEHRIYRACRPHARDTGIWGWPAVEAARGTFRGCVLALADVTLALRLQVRHATSSSVPLPLVSWTDHDPRHATRAWAALGARDVVFWGWTFTPAMLWHARQCDGLVSISELSTGVNKKTTDHCIRLRSPADTAHLAIRHARPWREAVRRLVERRGDEAGQALLAGVEAYGADPAVLADELGLARLVRPVRHREAATDRGTFCERSDGWYFRPHRQPGREALVSEAVLRIDRITAGAAPTYQGRIIYRGESVPFEAPARSLERHAPRFLVQACLEAGLGRPRIESGRWHVGLVQVATLFHRPELLVVVPPEHRPRPHRAAPRPL